MPPRSYASVSSFQAEMQGVSYVLGVYCSRPITLFAQDGKAVQRAFPVVQLEVVDGVVPLRLCQQIKSLNRVRLGTDQAHVLKLEEPVSQASLDN